VNWENIKEFLKPTKAKILATISFMLLNILGYFLFLTWVYKFVPWGKSCTGFECPLPFLFIGVLMFPQLVINSLSNFVPSFKQVPFLTILFTAMFWYFISCLSDLISNKFIRKTLGSPFPK